MIVFPENESAIGHIFRSKQGHVADSPEVRRQLLDVANDPECFLGRDRFRSAWFARMLEDGSQIWVLVRGEIIVNAGINPTAKSFNTHTGLKRP